MKSIGYVQNRQHNFTILKMLYGRSRIIRQDFDLIVKNLTHNPGKPELVSCESRNYCTSRYSFDLVILKGYKQLTTQLFDYI